MVSYLMLKLKSYYCLWLSIKDIAKFYSLGYGNDIDMQHWW